MQDTSVRESIIRVEEELRDTRSSIKRSQDELKEIVESTEEFKELERLKGEARAAAIKLKTALEADGDYNHIKTELDECKFKLKDLQDILSGYLVQHFAETRETEFADDSGDARQIIIKAKLGAAAMQERMFK